MIRQYVISKDYDKVTHEEYGVYLAKVDYSEEQKHTINTR